MKPSAQETTERGLFDPPAVPLEPTAEERFALFHKANPAVYEELVRRTRALADRGFRRLGIRMIWESMRFDAMVKTERAAGEFKLNDHMSAAYSRLIMKQESGLAGIFETRGDP